ncbi:exopolysaccharide transport family protein [Shinella sp. S4-D37]|uniref:GumC family protein n=1 Tax=Shinella sp. S4-D37 TaxID=3161999 RepID=UPI0034672583
MIVSGNPGFSEELAVPRAIAAILNRKWLILACVAAGLAAATVGYLDQTPRYVSEAVLALDVRKFQALPTESVISPLPQESPALRTEIDIMTSRSMGEKVLVQLRKAGVDVARGLGLAGEAGAGAKSTAHPVIDDRVLLEQLLSGVRVNNDGRSYTIYISFTGINPDFVAVVANAYAEAYIDYQVDVQTTATRHVSDWLGTRLVSLRSELERSEHAATAFREKSGIVKSDGTTLLSQQIGGLNTELAKLRAQVAGATARLETALDVSEGESSLALSEVLNSAAIQQLRTEEARLKRALATISESGAVKNPQIPELTSQLETIQAQISMEVSQIVESLRNEIEVSKRQQAGLEASLRQMQKEMSAANGAIVQADQLDREASANRAIYESYLARYKQTIEQDGIAMAEARIISRAMPSSSRTSPDGPAWLLGGGLFGLAAGLFVTVLLELRSLFLRRSHPDEGAAGVPIIGRIPELSQHQRSGIAKLICQGHAPVAHAVADLQGRLRLSARTGGVLTLSVTSAGPREGKTFIAACLARSLAATGLRTVLLEANLSAPAVAREFSIQPARTVVDLVAGRDGTSLDDVVRCDVSGVDLVCAGVAEGPVEHVLGHEAFARLLATLKRNYDAVVVDCVAVSSGSGALLVSALVGTTVFVIPAGGEPLQTTAALRKLAAAGVAVDGIVVNEAARSTLNRRASTTADLYAANESRKRSDASVDMPSIAGL